MHNHLIWQKIPTANPKKSCGGNSPRGIEPTLKREKEHCIEKTVWNIFDCSIASLLCVYNEASEGNPNDPAGYGIALRG